MSEPTGKLKFAYETIAALESKVQELGLEKHRLEGWLKIASDHFEKGAPELAKAAIENALAEKDKE